MKKQIDFDFNKFRQDGISVMIDGVIVKDLYINSVLTGYCYGIDEKGVVFNRKYSGLIMFEEVKPREFWVNVYEGGSIGIYNDKISAETAYNSSMKYAPKIKGETIKVREVIE